MHATRRVKLKDISPNLTCHLCQGYFVDATTIIECLHSFCRGCIVPHLEKSEYCPVCDVQLHSSKPLSSIRSDQMLQEIVYKLVPGLFQNEMARRRKHYKERSEMKPTSQQDAGHVYNESYITSDDIIHLSLELQTGNDKIRESSKRYIKCPAAVSISILKKLLQGKYDLSSTSSIEILYRDRTLPDDFLLMDIAYKYFWSQNEGKPLQLCYKFIGVLPDLPKLKPFMPSVAAASALTPMSALKRKKSEVNGKTPVTPLTESKQKKPKKTPVTKSANGTPSLTPNGKPRGRPKRKIEVEDGEITTKPVQKKLKKEKAEKTNTPKTPKIKTPKVKLPKKSISKANGTFETKSNIESGGAEVQLRISENGVISATSVSSGEEKIIVKNPRPQVASSATSPTLLAMSNYPHNFSNEGMPSPPKRPGFTTGNGINGDGHHSGVNGNGHDHRHEQDSKVTSPKDSNGNVFNPWKFSPEDLTRKPPNGKIPLETSDKPVTPSKRLQTTIINGDFKFTPIMTSAKTPPKNDSSSVTSSPKKPPKFFKSRHTEMKTTGTETNGDMTKSNGKSPENGSPFKMPVTPPSKTVTTESVSTSTPPTTTSANSNGGTSFASSPASILGHFAAAGYRFPMNMNPMNLDIQNHLAMNNLMPFLTNQYCPMPPFYNGHRPNAMANAFAMSMANANQHQQQPYLGFQHQNNSAQQSNPNPNTTLDLSMTSRKPISSYVQISPKKSNSQSQPISLKLGHGQSERPPVKRDKRPKATPQKKIPKKSSPPHSDFDPSPVSSPHPGPAKSPVPASAPTPLATIQTDALDFCHSASDKETVAVTVPVPPVAVPVPAVADADSPSLADSPSHNNNNGPVANGKDAEARDDNVPKSSTPTRTPERERKPETNGHDLSTIMNVNLNSPTSSSSPTSNNNNNIPTDMKKDISPVIPGPVETDDDDDDNGSKLIISESDTSTPSSCGPAAVSVNVISSSNTSSA